MPDSYSKKPRPIETDRAFAGYLATGPLDVTDNHRRAAAVRTADYAVRNKLSKVGLLELLDALALTPRNIERTNG